MEGLAEGVRELVNVDVRALCLCLKPVACVRALACECGACAEKKSRSERRGACTPGPKTALRVDSYVAHTRNHAPQSYGNKIGKL